MTESNNLIELFDTLAKILLRCFALGYALILLWVALYLFAGDAMNVAFGKLFGLAPHEANMVHYFGIALVKCVVLLFFLFPCISIGFEKTRLTPLQCKVCS